jgi:regulation of enolase protein 1 (concanavalin A-like superfamily)
MSKKSLYFLVLCVPFCVTTGAVKAEQIWGEAEVASSITAPLQIVDDATASGGKYITVAAGNNSSGNPPSTGVAKYHIRVKEGGVYRMYLRVLCSPDVDADSSDSCWVRIQGATLNIAVAADDWITNNNIDYLVANPEEWFWSQVRHYTAYPGDDFVEMTMTPGTYTVEIAYREDGLWIDGFLITNDADVDPAALPDVIPFVPADISTNPQPPNGASDVVREVVLRWTPSELAYTHNVYIGTDFTDVNEATVTDPLSAILIEGLGVTNYDPPGELEFGATYYWRVDEVNAPPSTASFKGDVWTFTTEPFYYAVEDVVPSTLLPTGVGAGDIGVTVDGSGLADGQHGVGDADMWLGVGTAGEPAQIQYDFDRVYKLYGIHIWNYNGMYEGFLGFGVKDITIEYATEPNEWMLLGDFEVDRASSKATYAGQVIDLDGLAAQSIRINLVSNRSMMQPWSFGLSEIRFLYKPVFAREPNPADGATGVDRGTSLSWRAGREAASHLVYLDTDSNAVAEGTVPPNTAATATYDPGVVTLGQTYYWRVDEVNDVETPTVWDSAVWSYTVQEYVPIDDFESYTDEEGSEIFNTWLDGYDVTANGSLVGHEVPPYAESAKAHSGQAMPLYYNNTSGVSYSEAELAFTPAADWTVNGADTLSLYYRGEPTGFVQVADDEILMNGTGADIWGTTDEFRFVYKQLTGNGSIIARIEYLDYTNEWAKAGVMIRQSLDSDSMLVDGIISADGNVGMQWRSGRAVDMGNPDASNASADGGGTFPGWVRLTRTGNVFEVDYSTDGVTWQDIVPETAGDPQTTTVAMTDPVYIGLAVTSHQTGAVAGSHFTGIRTTGNVTGAWQSASIGIDQPAGNGIDRFYLTVQDSSNNTATFTNPSMAAVAAGTYQQWLIPLSDISAAGVNPSRVAKLILGVGDATAPSKNVSGILYIDDIAFGNPIE